MSQRIHYIEGSSLPHFVQGDGGPMTKDEAIEMANISHVAKVTEVVRPALQDFIETRLYFIDGIGETISEQARRVMGNDRPLSDDDQEYYAFCDYLFRKALHTLLK